MTIKFFDFLIGYPNFAVTKQCNQLTPKRSDSSPQGSIFLALQTRYRVAIELEPDSVVNFVERNNGSIMHYYSLLSSVTRTGWGRPLEMGKKHGSQGLSIPHWANKG